MGRKAKIKQMKRQNSENSATEVSKPKFENTQFVGELTRQGYDLKQMQESPEIPARNRPNPQL